MKSVAIMFIFLGALIAQAKNSFKPRVGDYLIENVSQNGLNYQTKLVVESHNSAQNSYRITRFEIKNGVATEVYSDTFYEEYLVDTYFISDIIHFCKKIAGKIETISIDLGTFKTCKETYVSDSYRIESWYAEGVPFSRIKSESSSGIAEAVEYGNLKQP